MNIGIICEYNPFHYGHLYHIKKIKELYPNSNIILVLSGWITQRGELSLINKFDKAEIAIKYGINLVVELPYLYMQSADIFAKGAIEMLNKFQCDYIVFGSESNDIEKLKLLAKTQINNKKFDDLVKEYIKTGINYPTATSKTLMKLTNNYINTPNDILGLCYIKEIIKNNYSIIPITIKRDSNYNSKTIEGKITSSSSIRELLKKNQNIKKYVPKESYKYLSNVLFIDDYYDFLKYKIISQDNLTIYQDVDIDISNRINKYIRKADTLDDLINLIKTRKYTYNKIKRTLTYILFSITKEECKNLDLKYIRILGFDKYGKNILNNTKKTINIPLLANYNNIYLSKDLKINTIISLNKKIKNKQQFIEVEYKKKPIIR